MPSARLLPVAGCRPVTRPPDPSPAIAVARRVAELRQKAGLIRAPFRPQTGILFLPARSTVPDDPHLLMRGWQQGGPVDNTEGVLRRAPLFDALDDEGARTLRKQMAEVKLSRGEHLFMEGDDGDALYVGIDGKMKLTRAAADGRENLLSVIGPGEMFGELSLFDPRPRTSSASGAGGAVLASLKHEALTPWLRERPN